MFDWLHLPKSKSTFQTGSCANYSSGYVRYRSRLKRMCPERFSGPQVRATTAEKQLTDTCCLPSLSTTPPTPTDASVLDPLKKREKNTTPPQTYIPLEPRLPFSSKLFSSRGPCAPLDRVLLLRYTCTPLPSPGVIGMEGEGPRLMFG